MSARDIRYYLQLITRRYLVLRILEISFLSLSAGLISFAVCYLLSLSNNVSLIIGLGCFLITFFIRSVQLHVFDIKAEDILSFINRNHPQLEESSDLLLLEERELTGLQKLQHYKSATQFELLYPTVILPHRIKSTALLLVGSVVIALVAINLISPFRSQDSNAPKGLVQLPSQHAAMPASIDELQVVVTPPAYTGLGTQNLGVLKLKVAEGSSVAWRISFNGQVKEAQLIFYGKDTVNLLNRGKSVYEAKSILWTTGFYQLAWNNTDGTKKFSDYHQIEVVRDSPPVVKIDNLEQFVELSMDDNLNIDLSSSLSDDYSLRDAHIIATVSKGSGEAIKFREEKIRFGKPRRISGRSVTASLRIDLLKLGLDPGDELYFYVEALDNKVPQPNKSRTETFFISLKDTADMSTSVDPGLGVDLMPEYFRSQRQIIIDSEKLLKDKKKLTKQTFNSKSNELGYDEKVLRLRYGEFLGEEFETSIGPTAGPDGHDGGEEDVAKKYGHQHDTEEEHAAVVDHPAEVHTSGDKKDEDPSKDYMHSHDSEEEATFFTQSIRAKLKAAVTIMWDAELYLRLNEPEKSLPFQYRALKLLKEISQDSRIYVHRTGFDPPPLKEEKRLTGELDEAWNSTANTNHPSNENYVNIRKALTMFEGHDWSREFVITEDLKKTLLSAGYELSTVALKQPARYLKTLSLLKAINERELSPGESAQAVKQIRAAFYSVLPEETFKAQLKVQSTHPLDDEFLRKLNALPKDLSK